MIDLLVAGFTIGFIGSLHCIGMCGGLVGAMTMNRKNTWWPGVTAYQFGRITTYSTLGLLAGLVGSLFVHSENFQDTQAGLSIVAGMLIIILALHIGGWLPDPFARLGKAVSNVTGLSGWLNAAATSDRVSPWYSVGLINGLLPCGLVYAGIGLSLSAASAWKGAIVMFCFGLGTVPAMLFVPILMRAITPTARRHLLKIGAVFLILIGALTIARGTSFGQHKDDQHQQMMDINELSALNYKSNTAPNLVLDKQ